MRKQPLVVVSENGANEEGAIGSFLGFRHVYILPCIEKAKAELRTWRRIPKLILYVSISAVQEHTRQR